MLVFLQIKDLTGFQRKIANHIYNLYKMTKTLYRKNHQKKI